MSRCVIDASAVVAWLFDETGADTVEKVLGASALSAVNLAEVLYRCDEVRMATGKVRRAGRRSGVRLSLADCCCLATGIRLDLPVVGGDEARRSLRLGIDVHTFR